MAQWFLQPGILPDVLPDNDVSPYQIARSSRGMTSGNYPGMQTRFGHTTGNWDDMDAAQRMDAARAYNQNAALQNQALIQQEKDALPSTDDALINAYRPKAHSAPSMVRIGDELSIGGKSFTSNLTQDADMLGMDPDELAGSLHNTQRARAANAYRDYLSGNTAAGTMGRGLIDDPRFQGLDPQKQASIYQRAYGRTLDEDLQADQMSKLYGKPLTYSDIDSLQMRQKNQSKDLAYLNAMSSMMGTKGQLFNIANAPYDAEAGGVKYPGEYGEELVARMTPEQHAALKQRLTQTFFPQAMLSQQPQSAAATEAAVNPVPQSPSSALNPEEAARLADYRRRMLAEYQGKPFSQSQLQASPREGLMNYLLAP